MKTRRSFYREFEWEAEGMVLDQGYSYREICHQLDPGETDPRRWVEKLQPDRNCSIPKAAALTDEQKKIQELEARIHRFDTEKSS